MTVTDAKQRFSTRVADYVRYRPGYPAGILDVLRQECGLAKSHVIADVGSGTGLLSELFLKDANRVFGIEPNAEMRVAGEEYLQGYPGFTSISAAAEATTLAESSVDFVTAAQAFHWFDHAAARKEFARILRPGGWVVIIWNDREMRRSAFDREYEELLLRYGTDYKSVKHDQPVTQEALNTFFAAGTPEIRELPNFQEFDFQGLAGRVRSSSYMPQTTHANFAPLMADLQRLFDAHATNGRVRMDYTTRIYFGHLDRSEKRA